VNNIDVISTVVDKAVDKPVALSPRLCSNWSGPTQEAMRGGFSHVQGVPMSDGNPAKDGGQCNKFIHRLVHNCGNYIGVVHKEICPF